MAASSLNLIPSYCSFTTLQNQNHRLNASSICFGRRRSGLIMSCSATPPPLWLMLPPSLEGGDMLYNFYIPQTDKILPLNKNKRRAGAGEVPPDDAKVVGSSHGWLALFDEISNHVFLSNPISGQHIKLPAVDTLPDPDVNLLAGRGHVSRLILSCSPLEDDCRALMSFGPKDRLAFCAPRAAAAAWTPIGDLYCDKFDIYEEERISDSDSGRRINERNYEDFVFSSSHNLFFCITERWTEVEAWDLRDSLSPKLDWTIPHSEELRFSHPIYPWPTSIRKEWALIDNCFHPKYLVFSEDEDELYVVVRHVVPRMRPDGSAAERIYFFGYTGPWDYRYPYKTIHFHVYKIDRETRKLRYMVDSLHGLAMFVGTNHSFAVLASEFPGLKPDSIYFTDEEGRITPKWLARTNFGGHDNGVFDYRDKTISSCYYPVEYEKITRILPPPMWFTPTPNDASNCMH